VWSGWARWGAGIAEVLARSGLEVVGIENDESGLERAQKHLANSTARACARSKLTEDEGPSCSAASPPAPSCPRWPTASS
jgi:3-hydroxyacyl-CoA dehydrogenase